MTFGIIASERHTDLIASKDVPHSKDFRMTQKTTLKTRPSSATRAPTARPMAEFTLPGAILDITDDLMSTESLLATAIAAVGTESVDAEDVQITLVIVRTRLRATMKRLRALGS